MSDGQGRDVFVERVFTLDGGDLPARFDRPVRGPGGEFLCRWSIEWPDGVQTRTAHGEDGLQALMPALRRAHTLLADAEGYRAGRLTLWGDGDLDLPPRYGTGGLDAGE